MAGIYDSVVADFQGFLNALLPLGAAVIETTSAGDPLPPPLDNAFRTYGPAVVSAESANGAFYFGVQLAGAHAEHGGTSLFTYFTDPLEEVRPGVWLAEQLLPDGNPYDPGRWFVFDTTQETP